MRLQPGERLLLVGFHQPAVAGDIGGEDGGNAARRANVALGGTTAQHALDPCQQLARLERLGDVIVGAGLQPDDPVHGVARRSHHDDADAAAPLAQPARQREPVFARQVDVKQHQRRSLALDEPMQRGAAIDGADPEILPGEIIGEQLPLRRLVFDHDDMRPRVHFLPIGETGDKSPPR